MAWVRLDDQIARHRKTLKAGPAASWLWVCGIAHCQSQLTDGFISDGVLPMIGVSGAPRCRRLAETLVAAGLFERVSGGYVVHDYLDHNTSRLTVLKKRAEDAARKKPVDVAPIPDGIRPESIAPRAGVPSHPIRSDPEKERTPQPPSGGRLVMDDAIAEKAARFLERLPAIYAKARHGAHYAVREARDHPYAMELVSSWPDVDYLCDMYELFLRKTEWKQKNQPGSPGQFKFMAPECDTLLRQNGWHRAPKVAS